MQVTWWLQEMLNGVNLQQVKALKTVASCWGLPAPFDLSRNWTTWHCIAHSFTAWTQHLLVVVRCQDSNNSCLKIQVKIRNSNSCCLSKPSPGLYTVRNLAIGCWGVRLRSCLLSGVLDAGSSHKASVKPGFPAASWAWLNQGEVNVLCHIWCRTQAEKSEGCLVWDAVQGSLWVGLVVGSCLRRARGHGSAGWSKLH